MVRGVMSLTLTGRILIALRMVAHVMRECRFNRGLGRTGVFLAAILWAGMAFGQTISAQITVGRPITQDATWQGEVLVMDHVNIEPGVTLTILPGTRVKFQHYCGYREPERRLSM